MTLKEWGFFLAAKLLSSNEVNCIGEAHIAKHTCYILPGFEKDIRKNFKILIRIMQMNIQSTPNLYTNF